MPRAAARLCRCGAIVPSGSRCACTPKVDRRPGARARGYSSEWERARASFLAQHPRCVRCGERSTVVHHAVPHRGDKAIFWDRTRWIPMCSPCHNGPAQAAEKRDGRGGGSKVDAIGPDRPPPATRREPTKFPPKSDEGGFSWA